MGYWERVDEAGSDDRPAPVYRVAILMALALGAGTVTARLADRVRLVASVF